MSACRCIVSLAYTPVGKTPTTAMGQGRVRKRRREWGPGDAPVGSVKRLPIEQARVLNSRGQRTFACAAVGASKRIPTGRQHT